MTDAEWKSVDAHFKNKFEDKQGKPPTATPVGAIQRQNDKPKTPRDDNGKKEKKEKKSKKEKRERPPKAMKRYPSAAPGTAVQVCSYLRLEK